jgi:hypothetical protein
MSSRKTGSHFSGTCDKPRWNRNCPPSRGVALTKVTHMRSSPVVSKDEAPHGYLWAALGVSVAVTLLVVAL